MNWLAFIAAVVVLFVFYPPVAFALLVLALVFAPFAIPYLRRLR